ncbi:MAG: leucine-rich repeat protein [Clostridia bacterium]|nr:leucine-rich repeat protein [Clostridia bacterium]MCI9085457.1 leucine-rich repeat protein [Clostridia bacterium]
MKTKKIISVVSAICLTLTIFNGSVMSADQSYNPYTIATGIDSYIKGDWIYNSETDEIVGYIGSSTDITIPENSVVSNEIRFTKNGLRTFADLGGYPVSFVRVKKLVVSPNVTFKGSITEYEGFKSVEFYNRAEQLSSLYLNFSDNEELETLRLPEGLTEIQAGMCNGCTELREVYIPDTVEDIGNYAFSFCKSLREVNLPENLKSVGEYAFSGCSLTELKIPASLKSVGRNAFASNTMKKLYIPADFDYTLLHKGDSYVSSKVEDVIFEKTPSYTFDFYRAFLHTEWFKNNILPTIKEDFLISDGCLFKYLGKSKEVTIPNDVKVIWAGAFRDTDIEKVTIPNTVTEIGSDAFGYCKKLTKIVIPKSVQKIMSGAFSRCDLLKDIVIEGSPLMGWNIFEYCPLITDDTVTIKGEIRYLEKDCDPFGFTNTSYNMGGGLPYFSTPIPIGSDATPTPKTTLDPKATSTPTVKPQETAEPDVTATPRVTPAPDKLTVKGGDVITVKVNNKPVTFPDAQPFVDGNDRTQVPVRAVSELLNCKVDWQQDIKTAVITKENGDVVKITLDSDIMTLNDREIKMDTTAILKDDRTFIPVRFVAEALGLTVDWEE